MTQEKTWPDTDPNLVASGTTPDGGTWHQFNHGNHIDFRFEPKDGLSHYVIMTTQQAAIVAAQVSATKGDDDE